MIIVTGSFLATEETLDDLVTLSLAHVRRSRLEPGCISHAVHRDVEEPLRLVFLEEWADQEALAGHFRVPESRAFVKDAAALAAGPPTMHVYAAERIKM